MRLESAPQICVVKKEEKEAKLASFLRRNLMAGETRSLSAGKASLLMIARSIESPVARALLSLCAEAGHGAFPVRAILTNEDGLTPLLLSSRGEYLADINCRLASDVRLLDAHELLVLGPATAWIGDCMRRDPSKHDAYEFYSEDAPTAASSAAKSFERIWSSAAPLMLRKLPGATLPDAAAISAEAAQAGSNASAAQAATRH